MIYSSTQVKQTGWDLNSGTELVHSPGPSQSSAVSWLGRPVAPRGLQAVPGTACPPAASARGWNQGLATGQG